MNFWSVVIFVLLVLDYLKENAIDYIIGPLAAIYIGLLAIYVGDKEFRRWHYMDNKGRHPGELFVIIWTVLIFFIVFSDFFFSKHFILPEGITSAYIGVLSVMVITQESKNLYKKKKVHRV